MPPCHAQYSVGGGASLGSAAPVNPSLLAMFERPLRPSLHLGLTVRETALLKSSSRALSESLSHSMWLLSGLLGFVCLQGFTLSDAPLINTLVTSLSKCLAHQASISASHTAFVGLNPFVTATERLAAEREPQIYAVNLSSITALKYAFTLISDCSLANSTS